MYVYSFEKLEVWKDARIFIKDVYQLTQKFPAEEKFGIVSQIRRACVSISSNIAEGAGRKTAKDQSYFYRIAFSSSLEVLNLFIISSDLGFITEDSFITIRMDIEKISNKLNALVNRINV